jgi:hypothetical protein
MNCWKDRTLGRKHLVQRRETRGLSFMTLILRQYPGTVPIRVTSYKFLMFISPFPLGGPAMPKITNRVSDLSRKKQEVRQLKPERLIRPGTKISLAR